MKMDEEGGVEMGEKEGENLVEYFPEGIELS